MFFDLVATFDDYNSSPTLIPGINPKLCQREEAITQLIRILDKFYVAHIRGTPCLW